MYVIHGHRKLLVDHRATLVGFTRIAVNFKFHSWFANFKLT